MARDLGSQLIDPTKSPAGYPFHTREVWLGAEVIAIKNCAYTSALYIYSSGQTGLLFRRSSWFDSDARSPRLCVQGGSFLVRRTWSVARPTSH